MTETTYLHFAGLDHPVALAGAARLEPTIFNVLGGWPYSVDNISTNRPFVTISPGEGDQWILTLDDDPAHPRRWNAVNVVCDLLAEMAWERLRSDPALLCLHAAAVEFGDRLVIFPNARRAGKSTFAAALGHLGHGIYTDDFLPVRVDTESRIFEGIANGATPRIRLPLPDNFSDTLHAWVEQDPGPANRQYKYLCNAPVAPGGDTMPLGAMVLLDRQDTPTAPTLAQIPRSDAVTTLITQNFARAQLSGTILRSMAALSNQMPVFRLTYHCGEEAARYLSAHPALQALPAARSIDLVQEHAPAPLEKLNQPRPAFLPTYPYIQAPGLTETQVGEEHFLADGDGLAIYLLNAGSVAIWRVLSEPTNLTEVIEILTTAFEDVPAEQIATDSENLMRCLAAAQLIVPVQAQMVAE